MADAAAAAEDLPEGADGKAKTPGKSKKKLFIYAGGGVLLLAVLVIAYFFLFAGKPAAEKEEPKGVFFDLPELTVNLSATAERPQYLRVKVALEVSDDKVVETIKKSLPRVLDAFQVHMRELRAVDLEGSAGLYRLREELTRRINHSIQPAKVRAVLFKELVVQ